MERYEILVKPAAGSHLTKIHLALNEKVLFLFSSELEIEHSKCFGEKFCL